MSISAQQKMETSKSDAAGLGGIEHAFTKNETAVDTASSAPPPTQKNMGRRPYICETCNQHFPKLRDFDQHSAIHPNYRHQCKICEQKFSTKKELKEHRGSHSEEDLLLLKCDCCPKRFRKMFDLRRHSKTHENKNHTCVFCKVKFPTMDAYIHHITTVRDSIHFKCVKCGQQCSTRGELKRHGKTHSTRSYKCGTCKLTFDSRNEMKRHKQDHSKSANV